MGRKTGGRGLAVVMRVKDTLGVQEEREPDTVK